MAWTFLAESAVSHLDCKIGLGPSPIVKSIPSPVVFSSAVWPKADFPELPFGMTSEHLSAKISRRLTSFMAASPAKTSALLAIVQAWEESEAVFIEKSCGSPVKFDPVLFSWRTSPQSDPTLGELSKIWPASGMTVDGRLYPLPRSGRPTSETAGGCLLPTPTASTFGSNRGGSERTSGQDSLQPGVDGQKEFVGDTDSVWELQPQGSKPEQRGRPSDPSGWAVEPNVGRVAHGIPKRVDRLRGLGNAVVPAQAREAFRYLLTGNMSKRASEPNRSGTRC